jgi:ferric-dicitrate binding protein FerR (iron transport regulator)
MLSDIRPGTSKATLELADGSIVHLETEEKLIKEYDGISVQNKEKQLIYEPTDKKQNTWKVQYNTIKIPRGGEYQLSLSDGTQIWLNAETTLRYPVTFSDKTREVFLEGEAFFEIAKNSDWPFIVNTSDIKVNVLGTSFNIRAYKDEDVTSATLVSGKVSLIQAGNEQEFYLTPSDQAVVSKQETRIHKVNVDQFIAWKNGRILFEGNTLEEIFVDLSRWYNIETGFADEDLKNLRFNIDVIRYSEFNKILEIVELTKKVKFEIKGNKVIILKNS